MALLVLLAAGCNVASCDRQLRQFGLATRLISTGSHVAVAGLDDTGAQPAAASSGGFDPAAIQARTQAIVDDINSYQAKLNAAMRTDKTKPPAVATRAATLAVISQQRALGVEKISVPANRGAPVGTLQLDFYNSTRLLLTPDVTLAQQGPDDQLQYVTSGYDAAGFDKLRWAISDMLNGRAIPSDFSTSVSKNGSAVAVSSGFRQTFSSQQLQQEQQQQQQQQKQQQQLLQEQPAQAVATPRPAVSAAVGASAGWLASAVIAAAVLMQLLF